MKRVWLLDFRENMMFSFVGAPLVSFDCNKAGEPDYLKNISGATATWSSASCLSTLSLREATPSSSPTSSHKSTAAPRLQSRCEPHESSCDHRRIEWRIEWDRDKGRRHGRRKMGKEITKWEGTERDRWKRMKSGTRCFVIWQGQMWTDTLAS